MHAQLTRVCAGAAALLAAPAAAQVLIAPVVVEFDARARSASVVVTLADTAAAPVRLQAQLLRWSQGPQGERQVEPSGELLVAPAMAELRPGQRQVFRLALRGAAPAERERAYRLILEDISEPDAAAAANTQLGLRFRMRYDLAVLVAPAARPYTALHWTDCTPAAPAGSAGEACVRVTNGGNRRVRLQSLTAAGDGWRHALPLGDATSLLAGAEREWRIARLPGEAGPVRALHAQTAAGERVDVDAR